MVHPERPSDLTPQQEQLIYALLRERTKTDACRAAGVPRNTMYRWLRDPKFQAAYRAARRETFDGAVLVLQKGAVDAALALVDEVGPNRTGEFALISAADKILGRAMKVMETIALDEELAVLDQVIEDLKAEALKPPEPETPKSRYAMTAEEQAEACRLRVEWMGEMGVGPSDIEYSLRYNRPQSAEEEKHTLEMVRTLLEHEKMHEQAVAEAVAEAARTAT